MKRTVTTSLMLAAAFAIAMGGISHNAPAEAQSLIMLKASDNSSGEAVPTRKGLGKYSAGNNRAGKKDIWGDPDAFAAKCSEKGGGASTDEDGFPHCEDANGQNIPIPMEE